MRDADCMRMDDVKHKLSLFASRFGELSHICREYLRRFKQIPRASAFEIQHMCMHMTAIFKNAENNDIQFKHASSACGHLNRALLDAYKTLLFRVGETSPTSLNFRRELANCRQQEFDDGCLMLYDVSLGRYRALCKNFDILVTPHFSYDLPMLRRYTVSRAEEVRQFFQAMETWQRQDLLLSAITPDYSKNLSLLQGLVEIVLNGIGPNGETPIQRMHDLLSMQRDCIIRCSLEFEGGKPIRAFAVDQRVEDKLDAALNALESMHSSADFSACIDSIEAFFPSAVSFWKTIERIS